MRNGERILHPKLKIYGVISMLKYMEDGKDFFALFTYRDIKTGKKVEINIDSNDFKKTEEK